MFRCGPLLAASLPEEDEASDVGLLQVCYSVLGLWFVTRAGPALFYDAWMWAREGDPMFGWTTVVANSVWVALGLALFLRVPGLSWLLRRTVAPRSLRGDVDLPARPADRLQSLAFSVLGVYCLVVGTVGVIGASLRVWSLWELVSREEDWTRFWAFQELATSFLLATLGLLLFAFGRQVSAFWQRLKGATPSPAA